MASQSLREEMKGSGVTPAFAARTPARHDSEKSLSPGSQTFESALLQLVQSALVTQEEALANADSATNLLWLLNNGPDSKDQQAQAPARPADDSASFTEFTLNT